MPACRKQYERLEERIDSLPKRDRIIVKWTPEENGKLIELRNNGTDWETIASAIGRSVPACRRKYDITHSREKDKSKIDAGRKREVRQIRPYQAGKVAKNCAVYGQTQRRSVQDSSSSSTKKKK